MGERIVQLGLSQCPVCHSGAILIARKPAVIPIGGWPREKTDLRHDPDANVRFAVQLTCDVCGYMLLFDSEKFTGPDDKVVFVGPDSLEAEWEREHPEE